jgi:hypothetical protein
MDLNKIMNKSTTEYQVSMARLVLSFDRANADTKAKLLDSYREIIREYEEHLYHNREQDQNQGLDEVLDDPRHGQAGYLNKGEF